MMSTSEIRPDSRLLRSDGWRIGTFVTVSNAPAPAVRQGRAQADPDSAWPNVSPDNGALPRVQAADS
jgi:hypothetical protein